MKKIFLIGLPHSGKTTLLQKLVSPFTHKQGFLTQEILEKGDRIGFKIVTAQGKVFEFARRNWFTPYHVGKYYVKVENLNRILPELSDYTNKDFLYIDEIGQMELYSVKFKDLVLEYLRSPNVFIATCSSVYKDKFIDQLRQRSDITWFEVTDRNRQKIYLKIKDLINSF